MIIQIRDLHCLLRLVDIRNDYENVVNDGRGHLSLLLLFMIGLDWIGLD